MGSLIEARRRLLLAQGSSSGELYPIGTDLVSLYIGRDAQGLGLFNAGYTISNTGEYVENNQFAASPIFLPIDPQYRYQKTRVRDGTHAGRIYDFVWYDKDYNFISRFELNNLDVADLPAPPVNARFARFSTHWLTNNWTIAIVRIA